LSQILQDFPPRKYYLSRKACQGILRRARERGKELPPQLKTALLAQAGLTPLAASTTDAAAFAAKQRDEVRDLHNVAGALSAQHRGASMRAQRSGSHEERSRSGMSEFSPSGGSKEYGTCGDEKQQTFIAQDCLNPWDTQQARVFTPKIKAPTLTGADGGGGRNPTGLLLAAGFCAGAGLSAGSIGYQEEVAPTLKASASGNMMPSILCLNDQGGSGMSCSEDVAGSLRAQEHGHQPLVMGVQLFENHGIDARYTGPHRVSPTLTNRNGSGGNNLPLALQVQEPICISGNAIDRQPQNGGNGLGCQEGIAYTLTATDHHAVFSRQRVDAFKNDDAASAENASQHKGAAVPETDTEPPLLIRRLTPLECERLQGFPDHWTDLPGVSDSARYRALGNSVAIPCVEYIMQGFAMAVGITEDNTSSQSRGR
jgi:DNA (cytosine-5)-methyltransferase 1